MKIKRTLLNLPTLSIYHTPISYEVLLKGGRGTSGQENVYFLPLLIVDGLVHKKRYNSLRMVITQKKMNEVAGRRLT
jgi:hypothetical protein